MALILTLLITVFLLMLMTSFFHLNRDQIRFRRLSETGVRAHQAAMSGLEYARMRLEADSRWGLPGSNRNRTMDIGDLRIVEDDELDAGGGVRTFGCVGVLGEGDSHFQIQLVNPYTPVRPLTTGRVVPSAVASNPNGNFSSWPREALPVSEISINFLNASRFAPPLTGALSAGRALPSQQVLLQVRGYCQGQAEVLEACLGVDLPTDSSIQAGGTMAVDVGDRRWRVDSVLHGKNRVEAGGKMILRGEPQQTSLVFGDAGGNVAAAEQKIEVTGSAFQRVDDLGDGRLDVTVDGAQDVDVEPASLRARGTFKPETGVPPVSDLSSSNVEAMLEQRGMRRANLPAGDYVFDRPDRIRVGGQTFEDRIVVDGRVVANIRDYRLIFLENTRVDFEGSTTIRAADGHKPVVMMGTAPGGYVPWDSQGTFIKVNEGNLVIDGSLAGKGSVMTTGNSTTAGQISMQGQSQMSALPDSAVTLFAERNIRVGPPDPSSAEFFDFDLAAFSQGVRSYAGRFGEDVNIFRQTDDPLNHFASLGNDQNKHTQGGNEPVSDTRVSPTSIKTAPITQNLSAIKEKLEATFPAVRNNEEAEERFDQLWETFTEGGDNFQAGMTVGRYIRMREFCKDLQRAVSSGGSLPSLDPDDSNFSRWADLSNSTQNQLINDQLKAELAFFHRKANGQGRSLENLINNPNSMRPDGNLLSNEMNARDARWTGLMYARGSVWVDTGGGEFDVRGSLVARNEVAVTNNTGMTSVYDPTFLNGLTRFAVGQKIGYRLSYQFYRIHQ